MRFSDKVFEIEESFLNKWDSEIKGRIAAGEDALQFNLGQPDFACPDFIRKIIEETSRREGNNFYNHTSGTDGAREAIAVFQKRMFGFECRKEEVVITNGAKEAVFLAFAAILNPKDEVVVIAPHWPTYVEAIKLLGGVPVVVNVGENFYPDIKRVEKAVSDRTKAIVINSPNNPGGVVYGKEELQQIADLAIQKDLMVISDEVYASTIFDGAQHASIANLPQMKERTVLVDGFSKTLSMAGYRLGYAISSQEIIDAMSKIKSNINGNTNSFFEFVLEDTILNHWEELKGFIDSTRNEYLARRNFLCERLDEMKIEHIKPAGTFYVFARIPETFNIKSEAFARYLLDNAGVAVAPGIFFGKHFDDYFRISFGSSMENLEKGMDRIDKLQMNDLAMISQVI